MRLSSFILFLPLFITSVRGQATFIGHLTGPGFSGAGDAVATADGGQVLCGSFDQTLDIDPGPGTTTLSSAGNADAWIAKYDAAGDLLWGFGIGASGSDQAHDLTIDEDGNIHVLGHFENSVDLDPGTVVQTATSAGDWDIFWLKLDNNGQLLWAGSMGGAGRQFPTDVDRDLTGHLYVCGRSMGVADMDPGPGALTISSTNPDQVTETNITFLAKYALDGTPVWAYQLGGLTPTIAVEVGGAAIFFSSSSEATALTEEDFDPGSEHLQPVSGTQLAADYIALIKYDSGANVLWSRFIRGYAGFDGNDNQPWALALDNSGDVFLAGAFLSDLGAYPGNDVTLSAPGTGTDGFLVKYNSSGAFQWQKRFGAMNSYDYCEELLIDASGVILIAGGFGGTAELNSAGSSVTATSAGLGDIHVTAFEPSGTYLWHGQAGGTGTDGQPQLTQSNGGFRLSGFFNNTADVDVTSAVSTLNSGGGSDVFISHFTGVVQVGLADFPYGSSFGVFPNPANDLITLRGTGSNTPVEVFDALGQRIATAHANTIDVSSWSDGLYFVKTEGRSERMIIQH